MRTAALSCIPLLLVTLVLSTQRASAKAAPTSVVSGHVFCADTNAPARLAKVVLEPASAIDNQQPEKPEADGVGPVVRMTSVQTLPDGTF